MTTKEEAMAHAIAATFSSVLGSSLTTVAGFIALCFMSFTLGLDLGIVMAKGVVFGVISLRHDSSGTDPDLLQGH